MRIRPSQLSERGARTSIDGELRDKLQLEVFSLHIFPMGEQALQLLDELLRPEAGCLLRRDQELGGGLILEI